MTVVQGKLEELGRLPGVDKVCRNVWSMQCIAARNLWIRVTDLQFALNSPLTAIAIKCQLEPQVDVLVSEWMGYALLFETMLDTVLQVLGGG
jgi:hypothetical protein